MSSDCILGLHATPVPTAEQYLLVATHPNQVPRLGTPPLNEFRGSPFHLSAASFYRSVFRIPLAGFHLAVLRANPGPKAHISLLSAPCTEVLHTPVSLARQSLLSAHLPTQEPQPSRRSRVLPTEVGTCIAYCSLTRTPDDAASSRTPALRWALLQVVRS